MGRGVVIVSLALCVSGCASRVRFDDARDDSLIDASEHAVDSAIDHAPIHDADDARDVAPIDAMPTGCSAPLEAAPGTIVLRPSAGYDTNDPMPAFRARAENAAGDVIEVESDPLGIIRIDVGGRPSPWDVTLARRGWFAISILAVDAPYASDVVVPFGFAAEPRPDPIVPSTVQGTISGWSSSNDTAWLARAAMPTYSFTIQGCEPFRFGAVEFDATDMPVNALFSPTIPPTRSNTALDLVFPTTSPSRRHSVVTATLPASGVLSMPTTLNSIATRLPDDLYRVQRFGTARTNFDPASHSVRIDVDHLGDGFEPDGIVLTLLDAGFQWQSTSRLAPFADGARVALPMPGELTLNGSTVDDYTMQMPANGFDDVVFMLDGATPQDRGGWFVYAPAAALATARHWPRLPSGLTVANVISGYPGSFLGELSVCAQRRANGVTPWRPGAGQRTTHAVCTRRVAR